MKRPGENDGKPHIRNPPAEKTFKRFERKLRATKERLESVRDERRWRGTSVTLEEQTGKLRGSSKRDEEGASCLEKEEDQRKMRGFTEKWTDLKGFYVYVYTAP